MPSQRKGRLRGPFIARRAHPRTPFALLDALEPRQLLTVDLTGTFLTAPVSVLSGTTQAVTVSIANAGTTTAKGTINIAFYAALDGVPFDPNTARNLGTISRTLNITTGHSQVVTNATLPISAALPAGTYRLYAAIDSTNKIAETDDSNNTAQSAPMAVAQPNYDLLASFAPTSILLPAILSGQKSSATLRVVITNSSGGTATIPAGRTVLVQIVARPIGAVDASQDVVLNTAPVNAAIGSLAPGKTRTLAIGIQFPAALAAGSYDIIAKVDTGAALSETDETNNEGNFSHAVVVAPPFSDPALAFNAATVIPASIVADGRNVPLKFDVQNLGNVKIANGQTTSIAIFAHNLSDNSDTPLQTFTVTLAGLAAGATRTFTLSPTIPLALANGDYQLQAALTTTVAGDVLANNSASAVSTLSVGPAFYNLAVQPPTTSFNPAVINGDRVTGTVDVPVKNLSNTLIPAGTLVSVTLVLRPVGAVNAAGDIALGSLPNASLSNLAAGATRVLRVNAAIPATLPNGDPIVSGDYQIIATVTPAVLVESTSADNVATGPIVTIAAPFIDLAIVSASQTFLTPAAAGSVASGTVVLRNMGNVTIQGNITIQFVGTPTGTFSSAFLGARTFAIDLLPGASSVPLSLSLTLNLPADGLLATSATATARIDPASFNDANMSDNRQDAGTIIMSSQYVDLIVSSAANPFSPTMNAGATATGTVYVGNIGSGMGAGLVTVAYYAGLTNTIDGNSILLGSQTTTIALGQAQLSPAIAVPLTLPSPLATTTYKLFAKLTAALTLDSNPSNNITTLLGTVTVLP